MGDARPAGHPRRPRPGVPAPRPRVLPLVLAATALLVLPAASAGQGVEDRIRTLGAENGRLYSHPVSSGLGAGLASGWFHSARALGPLEVAIGVRAVGAFVPEQDEAFSPVLPAELTVAELGGRTFADPYGTDAGLSTPTAVGEGDGIVVEPEGAFRQALLEEGLDPADFALAFPEGFDLPAVPLASAQLNVGVAKGVELVGRYVPRIELDRDLGAVESLGGGLKVSVTDLLEVPTVVDLAVTGGLQSFEVGDYLSADARHVSVLASKTLSGLTVFASGALESSDADVSYTVENPRLPEGGTTVTFEDDGENSARFTAGFSLDLLFLQLTADYAVSDYEAVSAGLGVRF